MYHIVKTKSTIKPFSVVLVAENGEVLSQHSLKTKRSCFKNIQAQVDEIGSALKTINVFTYAQDDAHKRPLVFKVWGTGYKVTDDIPLKPNYIAGKNSKKKK